MNDVPPTLQNPPARIEKPADHPVVLPRAIGVLLVNLGTPDATDYRSMRRYLKEFLSDRRVIETSRWLWWPLLNLVILSRRPQVKGRDYAAIWNHDANESPLKTFTRAQADKLRARFAAAQGTEEATKKGTPVVIDWAMRYGNPSIASRLAALQAQGCDRILIVPLYPQYAAATTATVCDKAFEALATMRWQPSVRFAPPWHDDPVYIDAVVGSLRETLATLPQQPEVILASFHGIPLSYLLRGDPYHCQCVKSARLMRETLGMDEQHFAITFQSRFGPTQWLQPYTDKTVEALAKSGVKRLLVLTPGFVADCLETIEEIGVENRDIFLANGGEVFTRVACLNDSDQGIDVIETVVRRELSGWL